MANRHQRCTRTRRCRSLLLRHRARHRPRASAPPYSCTRHRRSTARYSGGRRNAAMGISEGFACAAHTGCCIPALTRTRYWFILLFAHSTLPLAPSPVSSRTIVLLPTPTLPPILHRLRRPFLRLPRTRRPYSHHTTPCRVYRMIDRCARALRHTLRPPLGSMTRGLYPVCRLPFCYAHAGYHFG